ncbi:hypothetical protein JCM17823_25300 [Halorubrum gandharaense]
MRQPDALDYALITAVTVLAYVQWPSRHALHERLLTHATWLPAFLDGVLFELSASATRYYLIAVVVLGGTFLLVIVEVLPRLGTNAPDPPKRQ